MKEQWNCRTEEWTDGRIEEWDNKDERMDQWMNGRKKKNGTKTMNEYKTERLEQWMNGRKEEWKNERMKGRKNGRQE